MGPKQQPNARKDGGAASNKTEAPCPHCGERFRHGDSKERLTHIASCRTPAASRTASVAASPTTTAPGTAASAQRRGSAVTLSPVAFPQSAVSWTVTSGGVTHRVDPVAEEVAMVTAMHSDTTTVMFESSTERFPVLQVDVAAVPAQADNDATGSDDTECRILLTFEYTLGYPAVAPNVSIFEAVKGSLRPTAARYILTKIGDTVRSNVAQQQPMALAIIAELHDAIVALTRVRGDAERPAFDYTPEPGSPVPVSPPIGPTNTAAPAVGAAFGRVKATPMGASQPGSNLSTPLHGAHRAALVVPPAPLGLTLAEAHHQDPNMTALSASSSSASRALEIFALHLLHRLCSGSSTLPHNAEQTIKVYLEDIGLLNDARRELNDRVLRRFFKGPIESAKDPVLSWLWSTSEGNSPISSPNGTGAAVGQVQSLRFDREFAILGVLGAGGFGSVLACLRHIDQRKYAVKRVVVKATKSEFVLREVRTLAALDHPNIVKYHDAWLEAGKHGDFVVSDSDDEDESDSGYDSGYFDSTQRGTEQPTKPPKNKSRRGGGDGPLLSSRRRKQPKQPKSPRRRLLSLEERRDRWEAERDRRREERRSANAALFGDVSDEDEDDDDLIVPFDSDEEVYTSCSGGEEVDGDNDSVTSDDNADEMGMPRFTSTTSDGSEPAYMTLYVQMEMCQPKTLADYIADGTLRRRESVMFHILRQLLGVLSFVHSRGAMHRDLKPANVLFDGSATDVQGDIKVADFGLARKLSEADAEHGPEAADAAAAVSGDAQLLTGGCGTPLYAAPEQTSGESTYDALVDEYSVGIIFYEMWMSATRDYNLWERREAISQLRETAKVPAWLRDSQSVVADVIEALVRRDPMKRASADEILNMAGLPGEAPEVAAALTTIQEHRDVMVHKVMKRLLVTARDPHMSPPAATPPAEVQRLMNVFERTAALRNAYCIDAHLEVVAYAHLPELGPAPDVLTPSDAAILHAVGGPTAQYDWALTHRGDPIVLLRDPLLCAGSWFARHSRNLAHFAPCHRGYCIHSHEADAVFGTYSVCGFGMPTGFLLNEATSFAASLLRSVAPLKGGYAIRLTHPVIAAEVKSLRRFLDLEHDRVDYAGPLPPAPTVKDLMRGPIRVHTVAEWKAVQNACHYVLEGAPPASRAALEEFTDVVVELLQLRRPYDLPLEVHPFGIVPSPSTGRPSPHIAASILRFADDGHAHAITPLPPLSSAAPQTKVLAAAAAAAGGNSAQKSGSHHHHHRKAGGGSAGGGGGMGHFPDYEVVGTIAIDPFISGLPSYARQSAVGAYRVAVCAINLSAVERNYKAPLPALGCIVALARTGTTSYNAWCGGNSANVTESEAGRVLAAAKDLWHHGVKAEPLYRQERSEDAAVVTAGKHGVTHAVTLLPDNAYRILRCGASAKELKNAPLLTNLIGETTAKELAAAKRAARPADVAAANSGAGGVADAQQASNSLVPGIAVPLETVESSVQIDFTSTASASFNSELRRRALAALAHYQRYLPPKRLLVVQDAEGDAVRQTLVNFANQVPVSGASTVDRGLFDWLRHHATHVGSLAVYTATSDTIDVLMNHRQLSQYYGSADRREGRNNAKGPLKKR